MSHGHRVSLLVLVLLILVQKSVLLGAPPASKEDSLHGPNHPDVSIMAGSEPLQRVSASEMELTFTLRGAVPGFSYKILVQEYGPEGAVLQVKWELFRFAEDACRAVVSLLLHPS